MRLLALDVGNKRVGVAFGDSDLRIATPLDVIERTSTESDTGRINRLIVDYSAERIIVGLPRNTDGSIGDQAKLVQDYASAISKSVRIPILLWDEHLSTVEASRQRIAAGGQGKKSRRNIDAIAAAVILQDYMDSQLSDRLHGE